MTKEDVPLAHAGMASEFKLQEEYYNEGKIYILQIESTLRCQQLCDYCYARSTPFSSHGMSSVKIKELLDVAERLDIRMIDWLGGDPLIREDWFELCKYASELGLINNIWTSGIPLSDEKIAKKVVEVTQNGFISTHLDTFNKDLYKLLHGGENCDGDVQNIELILKGIKNTLYYGKDPGAMVNCITYTTPLANKEAKNMISYMQDEFGIKTCLTLFNPVIHRNINPSWEPTLNQIKDAFTYRDNINYPDDPSCGPMDVSKFYCGTVICVSAEGWLTPCSVIRTQEFGNVNEEKLDLLIERNKKRLLFLDFRNLSKLPGNCPRCANNTFCFGCRSSAYYYEGDILAADPKCYQFKNKKLKKIR
ncbi:MAG: radical SAM protein [Candidatus Lokiarchaeota archaeon]|nr:radical SAM protein [Candidatus Lokiarchaeota archaeon]MBD3201904.1 radical SAM protein [Candidatus Lokiarchaeota archaeon]